MPTRLIRDEMSAVHAWPVEKIALAVKPNQQNQPLWAFSPPSACPLVSGGGMHCIMEGIPALGFELPHKVIVTEELNLMDVVHDPRENEAR